MSQNGPKSVLFPCLEKICLPSTTEAVFRKLVTGENTAANWRPDCVAPATFAAAGDLPLNDQAE